MTRVVITGMGAVTPLGCGVEPCWAALCRGECGVRELPRLAAAGFPFTRAGEVAGFALPAALAPRFGGCDPATQFMLGAGLEALVEAGLAGQPAAVSDVAVALSTNFGGAQAAEALFAQVSGRGTAPPGTFVEAWFQDAADRVAEALGCGGPRLVLSLSCASGTAAIVYGTDLIRAGRARAVLTGGYDALSRFAWSGLGVLRTMSREAVRPFDRNRDGTLFSEGAGALLLESLESATARGARILAEVAGGAYNNNAFHMTAPARLGAGSAAVMRAALADARLAPEEIDHINAHGTGTQPNDVTETQAIKTVFGAHAARMPITSIKGAIGHLMGAAGSVEAMASVLALRDGLIPPTTNFVTPDPECDLDYVFNTARQVPLRTVLSNSAGIGGCNAAVIVRRWPAAGRD